MRQGFYHCGTAMNITTLCTLGIKTLDMTDLIATASITTRLSISISIEGLTKLCSVCIFIVMLSAVMLRAIMLNIMLNLIMVSNVADKS